MLVFYWVLPIITVRRGFVKQQRESLGFTHEIKTDIFGSEISIFSCFVRG